MDLPTKPNFCLLLILWMKRHKFVTVGRSLYVGVGCIRAPEILGSSNPDNFASSKLRRPRYGRAGAEPCGASGRIGLGRPSGGVGGDPKLQVVRDEFDASIGCFHSAASS